MPAPAVTNVVWPYGVLLPAVLCIFMPVCRYAGMPGSRGSHFGILAQTAMVPEMAQWDIFLRNYGELPREMVTYLETRLHVCLLYQGYTDEGESRKPAPVGTTAGQRP